MPNCCPGPPRPAPCCGSSTPPLERQRDGTPGLDRCSPRARLRVDVGSMLQRTTSRLANAEAYERAWQRYVWPTDGLDGVQLAVFQVLAADGASFADQPHDWHLAMADRLVEADPVLSRPTPGPREHHRPRELRGRRAVVGRTHRHRREGMVVKPLANLTRTTKCRRRSRASRCATRVPPHHLWPRLHRTGRPVEAS